MSPRTGRPKISNPKDVDLKVRIDTATHSELVEYGKRHNVTKAEAARQGIRKLLDDDKK